MKPTEILSAEHRVIEQVLDCLEKMVEHCGATGELDKQSAADAIAFFKMFADRCHHGKEEVHLFPAMEARGFPRESGPTGVMLREHEEGRQFVRGMESHLDAAAGGDEQARKEFCRNARGYLHAEVFEEVMVPGRAAPRLRAARASRSAARGRGGPRPGVALSDRQSDARTA